MNLKQNLLFIILKYTEIAIYNFGNVDILIHFSFIKLILMDFDNIYCNFRSIGFG